MDKIQLKQKLTEHYNPENWKEILQYIFPNVSLFQIPQDIPVANDKVKSFRQLGNVRLNDGKTLAIFDVQLDDDTNISRNRVELRNLTAKYIDQTTTHGVLAVFSSDSDDYRFTFTAKETEFDENMELVTRQTEPKRYTYVLGPNESCKTPTDRFFKLHEQKDTVALENVVEAFSVEKLNKEFFNKYKEQYEDFVQFITGKRFKKVSGKWKEVEIHDPSAYLESVFENDNKQARDFVKKLLGRMVFLQFLQKKSWMGCSADSSEWENGDHTFCKSLFESANKEQFHSQYLAPLFDALNTPNRENDVFELTNTRVPYLNGGLFEADKEDIRKMDFPASHFESLLNFFGEYNFTIDENDPNDHEVGIDPEMLGHIFENLLEDNKDKGVFYTPKPIVQYMCQESLIQYLKTHLDGKTNDIENFIRTFDKGDENDPNNYILQNAKRIEELLDNVKICDPAIGSGAFPMGLLQMIFRAKMSLDWTLDPAEVKRGIIQNSIYGVDIEKGAVDIARLRFWLSLIVDEKAPQPLPNLDYKIMQGNSLLESFEGVDLKFDHQRFQTTIYEPEVDIFGNPIDPQVSITDYLTTSEGTAQFDIEKLEKEYFNTHDTEKKTKLKAELDQFERSFISDCLNQKYNEFDNEIMHLEKKITGITARAKATKLAKLNKEKDHVSESKLKLENMASDDKPYFLWHLYFMDVFKKGGFDIVIANPPYIKEYTEKHAFDGLRHSPYYQGKMDIWYFFACLNIDFLKDNGVLTFIATNNWVTNFGASKMRNKVIKDTQIIKLIDFNNYKIFDSAGIQTMIMIFQKNNDIDTYSFDYRQLNENAVEFSNVVDVLNNKNTDENMIFSPTIIKDDYVDKLLLFNNPIIEDILVKIDSYDNIRLTENEVAQGIVFPQDFLNKKSNKQLGEIHNIGDGIFALSDCELQNLQLAEKEKILIKPYFTTKEMFQYFGNSNNKYWAIYTTSDFKYPHRIKQYPKIKKHLDKFVKVITSDNKPYGLHRTRNEIFFQGEKIVSLRKCSNRPSFTYTDFDCYVSATFYVIKTVRTNQVFLTGFLNSSLCAYWLRFKGKMQGNNYQIDKEPLLNIPIPKLSDDKQKPIINLVDKIITAKKANPEADTSALENEIDQLVYELYDITDEEIQIVEESTQ